MPLPDECTLYIRVWTGQRCVACGAEFQYLRRFKVMRRDTEYHDTVEKIEAEYTKLARDTAEISPCPHCGWIQPDMEGGAKAVRHVSATLAGFLVLLINMIATAFFLLPRELGSGLAAGIAGVVLLFHLYQAVLNMNRKRSRNLDTAKRRMADDALRVIKEGWPPLSPFVPPRWPAIVLAAGLLLVAAFLFAAPGWLGWPLVLQVPGLILFVAAGSIFANLALRMKERAAPHEVVELNSTLVTDENVPADFQKKS